MDRMGAELNQDISLLFQVDNLEGLSFLLTMVEGATTQRIGGNDIYLKNVEVIDPEQGIVKITASYKKEFLIELIEKKVGGKKLSDFNSIKALYASRANQDFDSISLEDHPTEQ